MITAIMVVGALGLVFGVGLAVASERFAVDIDPRIEEVKAALPGANCGACGFPGCSAYAEAIVKGGRIDKCPVGGTKSARAVAGIMGLSADVDVARTVARVRCSGSISAAPKISEYRGLRDCRSAAIHGAGEKGCGHGCIGYGNCENVCRYGALRLGDDGLPHIDELKCTACSMCVAACPRDLIFITRIDKPVYVACKSTDRGQEVKRVCSAGCIGCGLCARVCEFKAIQLINDLAVVDSERCTACGLCIERCPTKVIKGIVYVQA